MPPFPKYPRQFSLLKLRPPPPIPVSQHRCVSSATAASAARDGSSKKTLIYLLGIAGAMVGASYAAVPLYRRFCQATGYGGTVQRRESVEEKIARHNRDGTTTARLSLPARRFRKRPTFLSGDCSNNNKRTFLS